MRGHSKGPFNNIDGNDPVFPVNRVQRQIRLTSAVPEVQIQVQASPAQPALIRCLGWPTVAFGTGTNTVILGNASNDDAYLEAADTTLSGTSAGTEKKYLLIADTTVIALLSAEAIQALLALTITLITGADTQTVVIGGQTYTFNTSLTNTANNVLIGADVGAMGDNLAAAINAGAGAGTLYGTGTVANASVTAVSDGAGVVTVTAIAIGEAGNDVAVSETLTNSAWAGGATALDGGENVDEDGVVFIFIDA